MSKKLAIILAVPALAASIAGVAVKLGNFTSLPLAWGLLALAVALALGAVSVGLWPYRRSVYLRSPIRILPAHLAGPKIYRADQIEAEFIRLETCFDNL